ncbi:hypothetical protein CPT_Seuss73 [Caulobacter phage Seuss]|uniref:Uncharacterized protein n=1 Tax=Caulobacter phage Seuss TaxID=1675601 RepID=A0A0K1LMA5_9CAUD|nr:hypothetical protein HOR08_gp073 [Caulobacter phage Seuss]AKU43599.1 hypothetical protein CPT_Seuss73 [Caulobacter phage Seuss]
MILNRVALAGEAGEEVYRRDEERVLGILVHAGLIEIFRKGSSIPRRNYARVTEKGRQAIMERQLPAGQRRPERRTGGVFRGT